MSRPIVKIHDIATNEVIEREMNDAEYAQYEIDQTTSAEILAKEETRKAIFEKLGLSADEIAALLG